MLHINHISRKKKLILIYRKLDKDDDEGGRANSTAKYSAHGLSREIMQKKNRQNIFI